MLSTRHPELTNQPTSPATTTVKLTLRDMRAQSNKTGNEVAQLCGTTYQSLRSWEKGASIPNIMNVMLLLEIYGYTLDELDMTPFENDTNRKKKSTPGDKPGNRSAVSMREANAAD